MKHKERGKEITGFYKEAGLIRVRHDVIFGDDDGDELENVPIQIRDSNDTVFFDTNGSRIIQTGEFGETSFHVTYDLAKRIFRESVVLVFNNNPETIHNIDFEIDKTHKVVIAIMDFLNKEEREVARRKEVEEAARRLRDEEQKRSRTRAENLKEPKPESWYDRNNENKVNRQNAEIRFRRMGASPKEVFAQAVVAHSEFYMKELLEEASDGNKSAEDYWRHFNLPLSDDELKELEAEYQKFLNSTGVTPSVELQDQRLVNYGGLEVLYKKLIASLSIVEIDPELVKKLNNFGPAKLQEGSIKEALVLESQKDRGDILKGSALKQDKRGKLEVKVIPRRIPNIYRPSNNDLIEDPESRANAATKHFIDSVSIDLATYLLHIARCKVQLDLGGGVNSELALAARVRLNCFDDQGNMIVVSSKSTNTKLSVKLEAVSLANEIDDLNYESSDAASRRSDREAKERAKKEKEDANERIRSEKAEIKRRANERDINKLKFGLVGFVYFMGKLGKMAHRLFDSSEK